MAPRWPTWWEWELEQRAQSFRRDVVDGRFVVETRHRSRGWEVIVEPDEDDELLVIVTAYPVG